MMAWWLSGGPQAKFGDAEVRILPPQPASPSLTHTESGRAQNDAIWRHFALTPGLRVRKLLMKWNSDALSLGAIFWCHVFGTPARMQCVPKRRL
jgi:hypothetical protein